MQTPLAELRDDVPRAVALTAWAAEQLGWSFRVLDREYGYLFEISDGRGWSRVAIGAKLPLNDSSASQLCADKHYAGLILEELGVRIPPTLRALSPRHFGHRGNYAGRIGLEPLEEQLAQLSYPCVVKPNRLSHGRRIAVVEHRDALDRACGDVFELDSVALIQGLIQGEEYRLDFLDGEYLIGYTRSALGVVGDGQSSLMQLLARVDPRCAERSWTERLLGDPDVHNRIGERLPEECLPAGQALLLSGEILNLNRGGTGAPVESLPAPWLDWARRIGERFGLRHFGLDLRVPGGLTSGPSEACVLEINSTPLVTQMIGLGHDELARGAWLRVVQALGQRRPWSGPSIG